MTTYSISLDDVDLALMPLRARTNDFLRKELYHFQVMKEETQEPPSIDTYTCHICAIEVPAAFAREHAASVKHRANASIASVATRRMRALIFALPPPRARAPAARFCANCATVADGDHDKTKDHRVAVMHDNLLWDLMKAYVGDDETKGNHNSNDNDQDLSLNYDKNDTEMKIVNKNTHNTMVAQAIDMNKSTPTITNEKTESNGNGILNGDISMNCKINDKIVEKQDEELKDDTAKNNTITTTNKSEYISISHCQPTTSRWVKLPVIENGTNNKNNGPADAVKNDEATRELKVKHERADYEKELRKFMDTNNTFTFKEMYNRVHIKRSDDTINVYSDHFHSYHRMYNKEIECIVCNHSFSNKDAETHKYNLNHMSGVARIGDDGDYVREINETYSHCILCNQKIKNINVPTHTQSQHHLLRKTYNIKSNTYKTKKETAINEKKDNEIHDQPEIDNETTDNKNAAEVKNITTITTSAQVAIAYPYEEVSGDLRCVVCDCRVPRDLRNRKDHVKGLRHVNNMK